MIPRHFLDVDGDFEEIRKIPPWVVAGIARESFVRSNPHRGTRRPEIQDLFQLASEYQNIYTPSSDEGELLVARITGRLALEQFHHQESDFEEISRFLAVYESSGTRESLIVREALEKSLGMSARDFVNLAVICYATAQFNKGFVPKDLFKIQELNDFLLDYDQDIFRRFLDRVSINQAGFRILDLAFENKSNPESIKYRPNPLMHFPILDIEPNGFIAPLPRLILRRSTHARVFQDCLEHSGEAYSSAIGKLFENYLGKQLGLVANSQLHKEIFWREKAGEKASVDWILVTENAVVLVESKSTKLPDIASMAEDEMFNHVSNILNECLKQIDRTYEQIVGGNPAFSSIPKNLPFVGIIATAESLYVANSPIIRKHSYCQIPYLTMSYREIEHCVPSDGLKFSNAIIDIASDDEKKYWLSISALPKDLGLERNPILDEYADGLEVFQFVKTLEKD